MAVYGPLPVIRITDYGLIIISQKQMDRPPSLPNHQQVHQVFTAAKP
jgi:hypothetical protein